MKRFLTLIILALFGLVLACGSQEEKKAPAKPAAPPAKTEQMAPQAAPAVPAPQVAPAQPKSEHPQGEQPKPEHPK
jgi:hypothetical protein